MNKPQWTPQDQMDFDALAKRKSLYEAAERALASAIVATGLPNESLWRDRMIANARGLREALLPWDTQDLQQETGQ